MVNHLECNALTVPRYQSINDLKPRVNNAQESTAQKVDIQHLDQLLSFSRLTEASKNMACTSMDTTASHPHLLQETTKTSINKGPRGRGQQRQVMHLFKRQRGQQEQVRNLFKRRWGQLAAPCNII